MRAIVELPVGESARLAQACMHVLESVVAINLDDFARVRAVTGKRFPLLYSTRVRYQPEPFRDGDHFDRAIIVLKRGWGDCDDLSAWRVAELRDHGEPATFHIQWRPETGRYHARVRRADGSSEDPSAELLRALARSGS